MGNLFKKAIASTLCASFISLQTVAIAEPIQVLPDGGLGGADIVHVDGGFTGVTNGTNIFGKPDKNDAHLNFNGDAVLDWGHLNVEKNQSLTFHNDAYVVLNNVRHGMSTFEGAVKSTGSGQIIISNPNGMLLQGGQFETSGALTLTTKDLTGISVDTLGNESLLNQAIDNASYKTDALIVIKCGKFGIIDNTNNKTTINADDIKILAKGIDVSNADIVGKNGVVLSTMDGANFVGSSVDKGIKIADSSINVATEAISKGGVVQFRTNGNVNINQTGINSLKIAQANDVNIKNNLGTVGGPSIGKAEINNDGNTTIENYRFDSLKVTSNGDITVDSGVDANVVGKHDIYGTTELTSKKGSIKIWDYNIGNAILKAAKDILVDRSNIDTLNIKEAANVSLTAGLVHTIKDMIINNVSGKTTVDNYRFNNLTANNTGDINVNYTLEHSVKNNKIDLTNVGNVTLDNVKLNTLNVNGSKDVTIFADAAANKISNALLKATGDIKINNTDFDTLTTVNAGNITINEGLLSVNTIGNANLESNENIYIGKTNFGAPLIATAGGNFNLVNSTAAEAKLTIGENATIESPIKNIKITDSSIGGNLKVDSKVHLPGSWDELWNLLTGKNDIYGDITLDNTAVGGEANLISWGDININNCNSIGSLFAKSQLGGINLADSHILGNAKFELPANEVKGPLSGHTYWEHKDNVNSINTAIDGNIHLNVNNDAHFTSPDSLHFVDPIVKGILTADAKKTFFEKTNGDLTIDNSFFDKYQLKATEELGFINNGHNLTANESANENFTAKLISFVANNINLDKIKANTIKAIADNKIDANEIQVNTDNEWKNILGKQNTVATFEAKDIISENSSYNGEVVVKADNAEFIQNDGNILKIMDSIISNKLIVDSDSEIYIGSWEKIGNNGTPTQIGNADFYTTNKITIWDADITGNTQLTADNSINIYDSNFNTAQMNANSIKSSNSNYAGDISATANTADFSSNEKLSFIYSTIENLFKAHSNKDVVINDSDVNGNADLKGKNVIATNNANFNGDIKVNAENAQFKTDNKLTFKDSNVSGLFEVVNKANLNIVDSIINTAKLTANNIAAKNTNFQNTITVNATTDASFDSNNDIAVTGTVGNNFTANSKGNVSMVDMIANKINATGKNVNLTKTTGDLTIDSNVNLTADNDVVVESTNGNLTVDGTTINAKNVTAKAKNNNEVKNVNIAGRLQTSGDRISIKDCSSDHLAIINQENNKFTYAEIFGSKANTTEFANGEYLYIDLTNSSLYNNNRNSIIASANNVDKIVIYPTLFGKEESQETTKNLNNLRNQPVDTVIGTDFSPIAFAANDNGRRGGIYKAAGDKIFKDTQEIVHITDRFNLD